MSRPLGQTIRLTPSLMLASVLSLLIVGCEKENSTGSTSPVVLSAENAKTPLSAMRGFDLAGHPLDPFESANAKAVVLIFVGTDCPISNRYAPEIRRLDEEFARSNVRFWLVYADADTSPGAIREHIKEYQLPQEVLRDPQHALVRLSQARVTPEAAVFLPGRRLVYHGRIDNRYEDLGKERPDATQRDLRDVLEAILKGNPVPYASARAVGCFISDPK